MEAVRTIVDAGPLIGWFNANDQWHDWSVTAIGGQRGPLHTTELVFGEVCHHLGGNTAAVHAALTLLRSGGIVLHAIWPDHVHRTQTLMYKFGQMDAGDASLVVLSEQYPDADLITVDSRHFRVYRRFGNQPLPLLAP